MINFDCGKLADYLDQIPEIKTFVSWWVWFGKRVQDIEDMTIVMRVVSDEPTNKFENIARVECRIYIPRSMSPSDWTTAINLLNKYLVDDDDDRVRSIEGIGIRNIESWSPFWPDYDFQDNMIMTKDFLFYYSPE